MEQQKERGHSWQKERGHVRAIPFLFAGGQQKSGQKKATPLVTYY